MKNLKCRVFQGARIWSLVLLALGPTGCAQLQASKPGAHDAGDRDRETVTSDRAIEKPDGVSYKATITGVEDKALLELLESSSQLHALTDRPPSGLSGLRRRADGDLDRLQTALRSEGFYGAEVRYEIDRDVSPIAVTIEVSTGPRYVIGDYDVTYEKSLPPATNVQPGLADLGLHVGMAGRAPTIVAAQRALLTILAQRGYPLAEVLERKVQVEHATRTMSVALKVNAGPFARFGAVIVRGLRDVDEDYVRSLLTWSQGDPFDRTMVESSRAALSATGLFGSVIITPGTKVGSRADLPVTVTLTEAKHRSFGFGFSYSTSEGVGGNVFWQHRNLLGRNEQLLLGLTTAEIEQVLNAELRKPNFLRRDQAFLANSVLANRNTDAFDEKSVSSFVGLERSLGKLWRVSAGVSGEYNRLKDKTGEKTFGLVGLPIAGNRNTADDFLNPTRGTKLNLTLTPYAGAGDGTLFFTNATASGAAYYAVDSDKRFVLAGRAKLGTLFGADTQSLPANKRFYAGGGGSIRGFDFQSVGPLDNANDPLGGRSLFEINAEVRIRVSDSIGVVPFIDGGTVFDSPYPDFEETPRWAAGLGIRYFTAIGPLRLDVGVPLNRRVGVDGRFEFYISLGQAF